jgi:sucrose phosphorylase
LTIAPRPQLVTYPDSLGGDLRTLSALLAGPLAGLFHGVHILPPFPSSGDRGFAPLTYRDIDPRFGTWDDIERISETHEVLLDLMVNHISRQSIEFQDFQRHGRQSPCADLFITLDKVWPNGNPPATDIAKISLRKPNSPFSTVTVGDNAATERVWTSFGTADWSEQIDLDIKAPATRALITDWLQDLADHGVRIVRLDAIGYVTKKPGTSCFMVEPDIYEFLEWISGVGDALDLTLLPEVHDHYSTHQRLTAHGYWTYDFVLPAMVLDAFHTGHASKLAEHLARSPAKQFTTLDCHDGIPVHPDLEGLLEESALRALVRRSVACGGNLNHILSSDDSAALEVHQINCTYYSALNSDDNRYVAARAIQLFARGVPQIYYVGLLAGQNDLAAVEQTRDGRAVNRHDYTPNELRQALNRPVVKTLIELIRLRNTHPAFDGSLDIETADESALHLRWRHRDATCALRVDVETGQFSIRHG